MSAKHDEKLILWFEEIGIGDVDLVGGKNASLGEMISQLENAGQPHQPATGLALYHRHRENQSHTNLPSADPLPPATRDKDR